MKDRQIHRKIESAHIPVLSPLLHLVAMPVIVVLRRDFGYLYLRPKSIFLAICWAYWLFAVFSIFEPNTWERLAGLSWLFAVSSVLYPIHLISAFLKQFKKAPHDFDSGKPFFSFLNCDEKVITLWVEPGFVLTVSLFLRFHLYENPLSGYLSLAAFALWIKEWLNQWVGVRKTKHQFDATEDAEEAMQKVVTKRDPGSTKLVPNKTTRKTRVARKRISQETEKGAEYYAAILRLIPPYSVEQAESNFQALVKQLHPDRSDQKSESGDAISLLTEAREFFRSHHSNEN